ncbi:MAG: hypothetical protein JOZ32_17950, partial [Bryobacterales bacterium]|nr:hypothetical protein [Bryobacterales bacterium]
MAFPLFRRKPGILGSSDPRASYWGRYRYRDGSLGGEVRIPGPEVKVIVGKNSAGKGRGLILPNLLKRTGISQLTVDTRCAAGAVSGPWRRTVDEKQVVANPYGCLDNDPDYADL